MKASIILAQLCMARLALTDAKRLYDETGALDEVLQLVKRRTDADYAALEERAKQEEEWCAEHKVRIVEIGDADYPDRLRHCPDAPLVLFVRGTADLNAPHTLSIVGTRKCTSYGKDCIDGIIKDLKRFCPDVTIVSGLAYGVDINAHRMAMSEDMPTIGVIAHGQDMIYPALHRADANKMVLGNGAVLTEYLTTTRPEARNFLQRNRIIAGMSDATIVVESTYKGGGLVTARLAQDYGRDVMAIPGPIHAPMSEGCNNLIKKNVAALITGAEDIISILGWENAAALSNARSTGIERSMFVELSAEEQRIVQALKEHGDQQVNNLTVTTQMPISAVTAATFTLEMKGVIQAMSGNIYHLIQ